MTTEAFTLNRDRCKFVHMNIRTEKHGDQDVPALDLQFTMDTANNLLSKLDPDLRAALYRKDDNRDLIDGDHMPALRFPLLGPEFKFGLEIKRAVLRIHTDDDMTIKLTGGKANNFKIEPLEGGTVNWKFRVQFSEPDQDAIADLAGLLQQPVLVSLEAEAEEETPDLFEQAEQQAQEPKSEARIAAEKLFDDGGLGLPVEDLRVPAESE